MTSSLEGDEGLAKRWRVMTCWHRGVGGTDDKKNLFTEILEWIIEKEFMLDKSWKAAGLLCENSDDIHFGGDKISVTFCKMEHYLPVEIWCDRRDLQSCKFFANCVNFPQNNMSFCIIWNFLFHFIILPAPSVIFSF